MNRRKLLISLAVAGALCAGLGSTVVPASAEQHTLLVTLTGGTQVTITVDVPPGTPVSAMPLPHFALPVVSVQDITAPSSPPPQPTTTTSPNAPGRPSTGGGRRPSTKRKGATTPSGQRKTAVPRRRAPEIRAKRIEDLSAVRLQRRRAMQRPDGVPTPSNPTFSLAQPGPAPIGVPNFFIEKFRIPPFLLSIYQAAGIQYGVPWQVLAAVNEIETDYGRNLSVSSAGAVGWMQFLPSSWRRYGVDANNDGVKDPYNPVDAIFAAARYLRAAGAEKNLRRAIFAYNHAGWYVDSVILRAKLIGGLPADLVGSLTTLTQGHFPVAARATYADDLAIRAATRRAHRANAAVPVASSSTRTGINVYSHRGAPVIAVNDGVIKAVGNSQRLGNYVVLQDVAGNRYTYAHLGQVAPTYPTPKPVPLSARAIQHELELPRRDERPTAPASAGRQPRLAPRAASSRRAPRAASAPAALAQVTKERLFAHPARPSAYRSGGHQQLLQSGRPVAGYTTFAAYFKQVLGLKRSDVVLRRLRPGAQVIAGTILGRLDRSAAAPTLAPHLHFEIQPAGKGSPKIDPKPILDGWKLLETTAIYRAAGKNPFFGPDAKNPSIGQILLMSKESLQRRVLADPRIEIYSCGQRDIRSGQIDRRVLATLEFLAASGLDPSVTSLRCGHSYLTKSGNVSEHSSGNAVDVAAVNGIPILGHQGAGSITDLTIRRLLTLQGAMKPHQIISLMTYDGTDNTMSLPDHNDHIHVGFRPLYGTNSRLARQFNAVLKPGQWVKLIDRLNQIDNPVVPVKPSKYAIRVRRPASSAHQGE